jgi:Fe2+ or Zn2+ uptake regulation protein
VRSRVEEIQKPVSEVPVTAGRILAAFEELGLRNTRPRRLIAEQLATLAAEQGGFATDDLWHELQREDPQIGRATVFRAVEVLTQQGILDRVAFADGTHRYRVCAAGAHHHHMICTRCHRVIEVEACLAAETLAATARHADFVLEGHSVELYGRCAECRVKDDASAL